MGSHHSAPQVLVIGIDGACWPVLQLMTTAGLMPNLSSLIESGVSGGLTSTVPSTSPPAWSSFMTGKRPGKHGIFSWWQALNLRFVPLDSRDIDGKTLWQLLGEADKRIGVVNVPMTYPLPAYAVNGFMISGMPTPGTDAPFTYPASLREELLQWVGDYTTHTPWLDYERRKDGRRALMNDLAAKLEQRRIIAQSLLQTRESDFFMLVLAGNDRLCHCLWQYIGLEGAVQLDAEGLEIQEMIRGYYRQLDDTLGDVLRFRGPETSVLVVSDHGFGSLRKEVYLNKWLKDEGFLTSSASATGRRIRLAVHSAAERLGVSRERWQRLLGQRAVQLAQEWSNTLRIDWSRTTAYSNGSSSIQINLKGREPYGIVEPGSEYEAIRSQVIERLSHLRDPDTGQRVVRAALRREDVFQGPHLRRAPDISLLMTDDAYAAYACDVDVERVLQPAGWRSGEHTMEGILIAAGTHIRTGATIEQAEIVDLAPTILYRMGVPVPEDMDGQILKGLFEKEFLRSNAPQWASANGAARLSGPGADREQDREAILDRLRGLGYVD